MSRKHHTVHHRTPGGYKRRLHKRGYTGEGRPHMTPYSAESLDRTRDRHQRMVKSGEVWRQ